MGNNGVNNTSSAAINGSGSLTKVGGGMQVLSGSNSYSGGSNVSAGTCQFQGANALPTGGDIGLGGGVISIANDGSGSGGTISLGNNITLTAAATVGINVRNNGSGHTNNVVSFGIVSNGTPLNALNSSINFTAANGYLQSFAALNLPGATGYTTVMNPVSTTVVIQGNVTNQMTSIASNQYDTLVLDGNTTGNAVYGAIADSALYAGGASGGATWLTKSSASQWILAGANTYSGPTLISGGTLQLGTGQNGQDGTLGSNTTVTNNAILAYNYFGSQTANYAIGGSRHAGRDWTAAASHFPRRTLIRALPSSAQGRWAWPGSVLSSRALNLVGLGHDVRRVASQRLPLGGRPNPERHGQFHGQWRHDGKQRLLDPSGRRRFGRHTQCGQLGITPGSVINFDLGHNQDLINVTSSLTLNGASLYLYDSSGTKQFSTPGTYPIIAYPGFLTGDPTTLSVANPSSSDVYSFSTSSSVNGSVVDLNILAALAWTGGAGSPFHWSVGNNWTSHTAIASGQAAYFQGTTGTTNVNDISGLSLAGIVFASNAGVIQHIRQ